MESVRLAAGSLVCLVAPAPNPAEPSQVLVARPRGKQGWSPTSWELKPVVLQRGGDSTQDDDPLERLPIETLFVVLRRGDQLGFKALGADGRTVQAVEALNEPHRLHNHNFGSWEAWEAQGDEWVNAHWRHKKLGYRVRPVLAVPAEVFARLELRHKREVMRLVKQLERAGGGAVAAPEDDGPAFQQWESREVEALRMQLAEVNHSLQHWQQEAAAQRAALEEEKQRGEHLQALRAGMGLPSQAAATIVSLRADLREAEAHHVAELAELRAQHSQQLEALRQEHSAMLSSVLQLQQASPGAGGGGGGWGSERSALSPASAGLSATVGALQQQQVEVLQQRLAMAAAEREAAVGGVRAEMQAALHAKEEEMHRLLLSKDAEIYWLLEERQRLDLALHTIKDMTALVRQTSPATSRGQAEQPQHQQLLPQQEEDSELAGPQPTLSPPLPPLPAFTALGVPVSSSSSGHVVVTAAPARQGSEGEDGLSRTVSIGGEVTSAGPGAERQGSSGVEEQPLPAPAPQEQQRVAAGSGAGGSGSQEGEEGSTAAGPAPGGAVPSQPAQLQAWEVAGAVDLGAALGRPAQQGPSSCAAGEQQQRPRSAPAEVGPRQPAPSAPAPTGGVGAVFNSDLRSRLSTYYDMLNPFHLAGPSAPSGLSPERQQHEEALLIRMSQYHRSPPAQHAAGRRLQQGEASDGEDDSIHRVAIGGSYLVDYNGPRPDSMTEDAMARILDAPLAAPGSAGANGGMRWRRTSQQQLAQQEAAASGAAEAGAAAAIASERNHTPSDQQPCCSAPASVGSDGSPGEGTGAGAGWASGSLSLPESTRTTPLAAQRTRDWGLPGALGDLPKEQLAARQNRGAVAPPASALPYRPSKAVEALKERSPPGADAVAQLMADQLHMRASMPEAGWQGPAAGRRSGSGLPTAAGTSTYRRLELPDDGPNGRTAPAHPLRNSAPAAPLLSPKSPLGSDPNGGRRHSLRRSSFLDRKPVPVEMLYGL